MPQLANPFTLQTGFSYIYVGAPPLRAPQSFEAPGIDAGRALASQWSGRAVVIR
jgi:hypothetical protein